MLSIWTSKPAILLCWLVRVAAENQHLSGASWGYLEVADILLMGKYCLMVRPFPSKKKKKCAKFEENIFQIILQNPDQFLNPLRPVEAQYHEALSVHSKTTRKIAREQAAELFQRLGFSDPDTVLKLRPFELSGGMCQRAAIAIAIANSPRLLLADEPTSALDVASQKDVMELLKGVQKEYGTTILLVTHNMSIVSRYADEVGIMYHGHLVEWGDSRKVLSDPRHAYTKMLLASVPRIAGCLPDVRHIDCGDMSPSSKMRSVCDDHCYLE